MTPSEIRDKLSNSVYQDAFDVTLGDMGIENRLNVVRLLGNKTNQDYFVWQNIYYELEVYILGL